MTRTVSHSPRPRRIPMHARIQYGVGLLIGLGISWAVVDYARFHAPRPTAPVLPVAAMQD